MTRKPLLISRKYMPKSAVVGVIGAATMKIETLRSPDGVPIEELMLLFADTIFAKAETLRNRRPNKAQTSVLRDAIKWDIKIASNLIAPRTSEAAAAIANEREIPLTTLTWGRQPKHDPGRATFILEHYWTVSSLRDRFVAEPLMSAKDIQHVLVHELTIVWITRDENKRLNASHRAKRPDPEEAYRLARIVIVEKVP
jgi:hypothetical protein